MKAVTVHYVQNGNPKYVYILDSEDAETEPLDGMHVPSAFVHFSLFLTTRPLASVTYISWTA